MREKVYPRRNFADVDVVKVPYIVYEPYLKAPSNTDFHYGEYRLIVLRNHSTGKLERLMYRLSGAVKFAMHPGYQWYWGDIQSTDHKCVLVFNFNTDGSIGQIVASFCGSSPNFEEFNKIANKNHFPAEFTAIDCFKNHPLPHA